MAITAHTPATAERTSGIDFKTPTVRHIKAARFLTPRMVAIQWGIHLAVARDLWTRHYHRGRVID